MIYQNMNDAYKQGKLNDAYTAQWVREAIANLFHSITNGNYRDTASEKINLQRIEKAMRTGLYDAEYRLASQALAAYEAWDYAEMRRVGQQARGW